MPGESVGRTTSNYGRYWAAPFNRPEHYPLGLAPDPARYRPLGEWLGRLILPAGPERARVMGAWIELHHTPDAHRALVGRRLRLRWENTPGLNAALWGAARSVTFDEDSMQAAAAGSVLAERLDGLLDVNPLESLAGAHPHDDVVVRLQGRVRLRAEPEVLLEQGASAWALRSHQVGGDDPRIAPYIPNV